MEKELKYHTDILILDILAQLCAIYMVVGENNFTLCQLNAVCTCSLAMQQRELTPTFSMSPLDTLKYQKPLSGGKEHNHTIYYKTKPPLD